jgi:hypothetical protein
MPFEASAELSIHSGRMVMPEETHLSAVVADRSKCPSLQAPHRRRDSADYAAARCLVIIGLMLTRYIHEAKEESSVQDFDDGTCFGEVPGLPGVWANEPTTKACREVLQEVLEWNGWFSRSATTILSPSRSSCIIVQSRVSNSEADIAQRTDPAYFRQPLASEGPISGKRHQFVAKGDLKVRILNPHKGGYIDLSSSKRSQPAGIKVSDWDKA